MPPAQQCPVCVSHALNSEQHSPIWRAARAARARTPVRPRRRAKGTVQFREVNAAAGFHATPRRKDMLPAGIAEWRSTRHSIWHSMHAAPRQQQNNSRRRDTSVRKGRTRREETEEIVSEKADHMLPPWVRHTC